MTWTVPLASGFGSNTVALKLTVEEEELPADGEEMVTLGERPSTVIVVVTEALRFPAASFAANWRVHEPSEPQPRLLALVEAWKMLAVPETKVMLMFVAPELPETLILPSSLLRSVTLTLIWMIWELETVVSFIEAFKTEGRVVSIVNVTDWELFIWLKESLIMKMAV